MRIGARALLTLVPVAVLPLLGAGLLAFRVSRRALEERTRAAQVSTARFLAERISSEVRASLHAAGLAASAMDFAQLSGEERLGALRLLFRQIEGACAVALLSPQGAQLAEPVYLAARARRIRCSPTGRSWTRPTSKSSPAAFRSAPPITAPT
jgi:hypothetical protein